MFSEASAIDRIPVVKLFLSKQIVIGEGVDG